jgi:hypothetical protein
MLYKTLLLTLSVVFAGFIASQRRDIRRYLTIRQMSLGHGHPEHVPAAGTARYPHDAVGSEPDGTGEFDSMSRGGPAGR